MAIPQKIKKTESLEIHDRLGHIMSCKEMLSKCVSMMQDNALVHIPPKWKHADEATESFLPHSILFSIYDVIFEMQALPGSGNIG